MFKFDIKFLNETYFFISCAYKIKNRLKFKVYDQFEKFWFKTLKKKKFKFKALKNYITKKIIRQFFIKLTYFESLKYFICIKYKKNLTKSFKLKTFKWFFKYLQEIFKFSLTKLIVCKNIKIKLLKRKNLTKYKNLIYFYILKIFDIFYLNNIIRSKNLNYGYFYLFIIKNQKKHYNYRFDNLYFLKHKNYVNIIYKKNLDFDIYLKFLKTKQYVNMNEKKNIQSIDKNTNIYLNKYTVIKMSSIKIINFNLKKLKFFNYYFQILNLLKNKIVSLKKKNFLVF